MIKRVVKTMFLVGLAGCALVSCRQEKQFRVKGQIRSGKGDTLFLEHRGLGGVVPLDSVVLKGEGNFTFQQAAPHNPEFYQLRIGKQVAVFAVDSAVSLHLSADAGDLYRTLSVDDSPSNAQLRQVDALTMEASRRIKEREKQHKAQLLDDMAYITQLDAILKEYKSEISKLIMGDPAGAAAYYAVFQKIDNYLIFDPYDKQDYAMFGAVATSWNRYYPDTERTKHLYGFAMNALKARKQQEHRAAALEKIPVTIGLGLPDISLPQVNGSRRALSSLKGKVVLLDFVVYQADFSPKHNMDLNTVYRKYRSRGLEIYQISLDSDEHFWKTSADNLPWMTVRDPLSVNSSLLSTYNVRQLPTGFILDREGDVVVRIEDYQQLSAELDKVL